MTPNETTYRKAALQVYRHLLTYDNAVKRAFLLVNDKKGLNIGFTVNLKLDQRTGEIVVPSTKINLTAEKITDIITGDVPIQLELDFEESPRKLPADYELLPASDLRTLWHTKYMAWGNLEEGFDEYISPWRITDVAAGRVRDAKLGGVVDYMFSMEPEATDPSDQDQGQAQDEAAAEGESCWRPDTATAGGGAARA